MKRREFLKRSAPAFMAATMMPTLALADGNNRRRRRRRRRRSRGRGHDVPEIDMLQGTVAVGLVGAVLLLIRERFKARSSSAE